MKCKKNEEMKKKVPECFAGFKKSCTFALAIRRNGNSRQPEREAEFTEKAFVWRGGGIGRRATLRW